MIRAVLTVESVDKILWCDHSNYTSLPVLFHGMILFFQHFTNYNLYILVNFAFGHFWEFKGYNMLSEVFVVFLSRHIQEQCWVVFFV